MVQYDKFADIYDVDLGKIDRDLEMYSEMFSNAKKVLILSCGTGRETYYLANIFNEVWGLDISENMISEARKKTQHKNNVKYIQADMSKFEIDKKFDLILIPNNGILHLLKTEHIENCLRSCSKHLSEGGVLALDFFIPDFKALASPKSEKIHDFTKFDSTQNEYITRERIHIREPFRKLNHTQIFYEFTDLMGKSRKRICEYTIRYLFTEEFDLLARLTDFNIVNKYGGFNREEFGPQHTNVVYVLRKG